MKNKFKKVLALILAVSALSIPSSVLAHNETYTDDVEANPGTARWSYIMYCDCSLLPRENAFRKLEASAGIIVYEGYCGVELQLEKLGSDGKTWSDVNNKYWSAYSESDSCDFYKDDISVSAGTYRCKIIYTAYTTSGIPIESHEVYTQTATIY